MDDRAVSPVIAVMLILAITVTILSVGQMILIPSMKAESDSDNLRSIEDSILRFASDIEVAAALKQDLWVSQRLRLGGGETLFNPSRSSGTLRVFQEPIWIQNITIRNGTSSVTASTMLINFSYTPTGNYWQDQGYIWQYGYVNISKAGTETPLEFATMESVNDHLNSSGFGRNIFDIDFSLLTKPHYNATGFPVFNPNGSRIYQTDTTWIQISVANFTSNPQQNFISGNGFGRLALDCNVQEMSLPEDPTEIIFTVNNNLPVPINTQLWEKQISNANLIVQKSGNIIENARIIHPDYNELVLSIDQSGTPVDISLRIADISVLAY